MIYSLLSLLLALAANSEVIVVTMPKDNVTLDMAPAGQVELKRDGALTRVKLEVDRLRPPQTMGESLYCYVAWAVSPEGVVENLGTLTISGNKGRIDTVSRFEQLGIIVTAEPHFMVDRPSIAVAYRNQPPRDDAIRRVPVQILIGTYGYASVQLPPQGALPSIVSQARVAVQIAANGGGERWAEAEFRLAVVARDTMEEMLRRATPMDLVATIANEAVRRAHQAFLAARIRATELAMEQVEQELAEVSEERQRVETRLREATEQLNAANNQIRALNERIASAGRTTTELSEQRQQAETNQRNAERELARLKSEQEGLQNRLTLRMRPEFFDDNGLTQAGRDALARVCGIAEVVSGPIRLEGFPSDLAFQAVMLYMVEAGVPHDRIIARR
ncbi:MAG: hypothetical protein HY646_01290 [Acidobacteria bacterium]|nr:hypothetical protein [Acidobacteriota bacterium]